MTLEPKIYVADLAAYNNGVLHGEWIDAAQDIEDLKKQVLAMLKASPIENAEEYAIHDYEGFESVCVSEYEGLESVNKKALFIDEHGVLGAAILSHWCDDSEDATKAIDECYYGEYRSVSDFAHDLTEQTSEVPKHLELYIDYEAMGRDMEMNGDIYTIETAHDEVHIFWNH